ncbi:MAG: BglG family transcription antiterminator [Firmicutes bacterium]|nr:BglG family transcription antiterminator [Bacillota bacterium]MCL5039728.1 BglG family transcription antiterminator [Bacillota bacterium]
MNLRRKRLLEFLITNRGTPKPALEIARGLKVSPRTIRTDLDALEFWVRKRRLSIHRQPGRGIWLEAPDDQVVHQVLQEAEPSLRFEYVLGEKERQNLIISWLLQSPQPLTVSILSKRLFLSRNTIEKDLRLVEASLSRKGLKLLRARGVGLRVEGTEMACRQAMVDLLDEIMQKGQLLPYLGGAEEGVRFVLEDEDSYVRQIASLIDSRRLKEIRELVKETTSQFSFPVADGALLGLVIHLAVAITRIEDGMGIKMPEERLLELRSYGEFKVAQAIARSLEGKYEVKIPPSEVGYISLHLLGMRMAHGLAAAVPPDEPVTIAGLWLELARQYLEITGHILGVGLLDDRDLLLGLAIHLRPIANRLRYGLPLRNPLLDDIKVKYPGIFFIAKQGARFLESRWGLPIPEEEIGYLAIHLGASLEKKRLFDGRIRAAICCGSGIGTARLVASFINNHFPEIEVLEVLSRFEVKQFLSRHPEVNLIISTIPIADTSRPILMVPAVPGEEDVEELRQKLGLAIRQKEPRSGPTPNSDRVPNLADLLTQETIALEVEALDWKTAVIRAGELLIRTGRVLEDYVHRMVAMIEELGPYVVVEKGIAIPHAPPQFGVKSVGLSLIRLKAPVAFGSKVNDPVDLVFALSTTDYRSHLTALRQLNSLLSNNEKLAVLRSGREKVDILGVVAAFSRQTEKSEA